MGWAVGNFLGALLEAHENRVIDSKLVAMQTYESPKWVPNEVNNIFFTYFVFFKFSPSHSLVTYSSAISACTVTVISERDTLTQNTTADFVGEYNNKNETKLN